MALAMLLAVFALGRVAALGTGAVMIRSAAVFVSAFALPPLSATGHFATYALVPDFAEFVDRSLLDDRGAQVVLALKFGCTGFLMTALVIATTPNLEISLLAFAGLAVGLSAAASRRRSADATPPEVEQVTLHSSQISY